MFSDRRTSRFVINAFITLRTLQYNTNILHFHCKICIFLKLASQIKNRLIFCQCVLRKMKEFYLNSILIVSREILLECLPLIITWIPFVTSCLFTYQINHTQSVDHPHTLLNNGREWQKVIMTPYYKNHTLTVTGECDKFLWDREAGTRQLWIWS